MQTDARLRLLDDWGVDASIVFPTIGILWDKEDDPELAIAYARAYNRWQWDFAEPDPSRIVPIAHIPLYDVDLALAELRRCLALGFKGMFLAPEPVGGKRPSHPDFDPIWHEMQAAGLPVCLHVIVRFNRRVAGFAQWFDAGKGEFNATFGFGLGGTFQLIPAVSALVCDGLFDRFPELKLLVVEAGAGWAGYVMDRLDEKYARFGSTSMKRAPSEYFRRNVWVVFDPGERSIDSQCDLLGEDRLLWGSDYPHIDSHIDAPDEIRASVAGLSERRRRLVLGENARALFQLDR
jgi:predicted TIM-barrel fold metal-dependent hydrolase